MIIIIITVATVVAPPKGADALKLLDYTEYLSLARKTGDLSVSKQQCANAPKGRNLVISLFSANSRLPWE